MEHEPFQEQSMNAIDNSQDATLSSYRQGFLMNGENQASSLPHIPEMLNFSHLLDNLLKLVTDLQNDIIHFQDKFLSHRNIKEANGNEVPQAHKFHRTLKNKMDVLSCVTKIQRKMEESYVWPLMESLFHDSSTDQLDNYSRKTCLNPFPLHYKNVDKILRKLHLNLRQLKMIKQSQFQHIICDVVSLLKEHSSELSDSFNELVKTSRTNLSILMNRMDENQLCNLKNNIYCERNVKEITNNVYTAVCSSVSLDIKEILKLFEDVVNGTFIETLLDKGKWTTLFKFGSEYDEPNLNIAQLVPEVLYISTETGLNHLKRKLIRYFPSQRKRNSQFEFGRVNEGKLTQQVRRPSKYYKRSRGSSNAPLGWDSNSRLCFEINKASSFVPLFHESELKPTFNKNSELGCSHYERSCKLRHPITGRLHTCRFCCETSNNSSIECPPPLDRFAVSEILCMRCNTLQPSGRSCINPECDSKGTPFAKYVCTHCNLYENDGNKDIYHCPHCNVCKIGKGLGIDFKHCMDCDACISMDEFENHICIPQRLKRKCPLCLTGPLLSDSTEPIQSMGCGHSFHTSCYNLFSHLKESNKMKCPICRHEDEVN